MIKYGIENTKAYQDILKNKRIGLITNPTGVDQQLKSSIDILKQDFNLTALFGPEHGVRGDIEAGVHVADYHDQKTGCPVYSLYGKNRKPSAEMLSDVDILCYDIMDVGARFYTFIYTMAYAMMACKEHNIPFVVFDRPNPLGGEAIEGLLLDVSYRSFVGYYPILQRYGLTCGELALLFNDAFEIGCELHVVPMIGWKRHMHFADTKAPWVMPSPNIPTSESVYTYIATCLFEGTNLSEGRGTTKPFSVIGAPWLKPLEVINEIKKIHLEGVLFRPTSFTPTFSKHQQKFCQGIELHVTDRYQFNPVKTGYALFDVIRYLHKDFTCLAPYKEGMHPMIDLLTGSDFLRTERLSIDALFAKMSMDEQIFQSMKTRYHLYE